MNDNEITKILEIMNHTIDVYLVRAKQNPLKAQKEIFCAQGVAFATWNLLLFVANDDLRIMTNQAINEKIRLTIERIKSPASVGQGEQK
jgi:hypothetical protein